MKLEEKLVSLRKAKGLSQMKLAEKMNVSRQAISRWETGAAIPSSENLKYLSDLYSVSLDYLLSDSADAPEQNRRISNEPDGEMVTISDSADGGKKGKQKTAKWLAILMVVVALITVIVITYLNQKETEPIEQNTVKFEELQKDERIFICALYESDSGTSISHFTRSNGIADAREAISLAEDLGMPTGNPIYFCIDTDVTKSQMTTYIVPYVQGILSELEGSGYKLGIYGPKPVCKYIRGTYSATERYMMICDNDWGQSGWSATERDFDDWNIRQYEWNQSLPGVSSVTIDKCESSTNGGGGWKL